MWKWLGAKSKRHGRPWIDGGISFICRGRSVIVVPLSPITVKAPHRPNTRDKSQPHKRETDGSRQMKSWRRVRLRSATLPQIFRVDLFDPMGTTDKNRMWMLGLRFIRRAPHLSWWPSPHRRAHPIEDHRSAARRSGVAPSAPEENG